MSARRIGSSSTRRLVRYASASASSSASSIPPPPPPPLASHLRPPPQRPSSFPSASTSASSLQRASPPDSNQTTDNIPPPPSPLIVPPPSLRKPAKKSKKQPELGPIHLRALENLPRLPRQGKRRAKPQHLADLDSQGGVHHRLSNILLASSPSNPGPQGSSSEPSDLPALSSALLICQEMVHHNVPPSAMTYSLLIQICLKAQSDRALEYNLPDPSELPEGSVALEELLVEKRYLSEMTWLEKRRRLLWQGLDPTQRDKPERGAWFGSAEFEIAWGFYLDAEARGITIPRPALDALIKLSHIHPSLTSRVTPLLTATATSPSAQSLELALLPYISIPRKSESPTDALSDVDRILSIYADARAQGMFPSKEAISQIVLRLVAVGWSNAAVDLAIDYEENQKDPTDLLAPETWGNLMRAIARKGKTASLLTAWTHAVNSSRLSPDIGLITDCLLLFGRAGLPEITLQLLTLLKSKGIPMAEHHYASLLQSWIAIDDLEAAMYTLALMRLEGCPPNSETANPLLGLIVGERPPVTLEEVEEVTARVDRAWFTLVESKEKRGVVDVTAGNALLLSCLSITDFVRTAETFNEFASLGITPNLDSYHHLLDACLLRPTETYPLFLKIQSVLKSHNIAYTNRTYERLIAYLCAHPPSADADRAENLTPEQVALRELVSESKNPAMAGRSKALVRREETPLSLLTAGGGGGGGGSKGGLMDLEDDDGSPPPRMPISEDMLSTALSLLSELKSSLSPSTSSSPSALSQGGPTRRTYTSLLRSLASHRSPLTGPYLLEMRSQGFSPGRQLSSFIWDQGGATAMAARPGLEWGGGGNPGERGVKDVVGEYWQDGRIGRSGAVKWGGGEEGLGVGVRTGKGKEDLGRGKTHLVERP